MVATLYRPLPAYRTAHIRLDEHTFGSLDRADDRVCVHRDCELHHIHGYDRLHGSGLRSLFGIGYWRQWIRTRLLGRSLNLVCKPILRRFPRQSCSPDRQYRSRLYQYHLSGSDLRHLFQGAIDEKTLTICTVTSLSCLANCPTQFFHPYCLIPGMAERRTRADLIGESTYISVRLQGHNAKSDSRCLGFKLIDNLVS